MKNGFDPALLYELQYTVKDPLVLGIGLAATRDLGSFFRYEKQDASGTPNPVAGTITHAISEGSSQSGTFLRLSLLLGFNQDERGRIVWDGMNPHIAARFTDLNRRFAFPGGLVSPFELGHEGPAWWTPWEDTARKRPAASLLDRCRATNTCPKIAETFGSAEVWGLRQSFTLVGTTAKKDIPLPENVRRYYFPGVSHGGGPGGFATLTNPVKAAATCALPTNPAPVGPMRAALISRLVAWVTTNTPMPESKYPTLADGTLVRNTNAAMGFPAIPGKPMPEGVQFPLVDYDLGSQFRYADQSGVLTKVPVAKGTLPQLVVRVDADGNEVAGIKSPLLSAPLGTYTGWNVTTSGLYTGTAVRPELRLIADRRVHSVREDQGRAHGEWRSAPVARRALHRSRRLRARGESRRRQTRARRVSARGRCGEHDHAGRKQLSTKVERTTKHEDAKTRRRDEREGATQTPMAR